MVPIGFFFIHRKNDPYPFCKSLFFVVEFEWPIIYSFKSLCFLFLLRIAKMKKDQNIMVFLQTIILLLSLNKMYNVSIQKQFWKHFVQNEQRKRSKTNHTRFVLVIDDRC